MKNKIFVIAFMFFVQGVHAQNEQKNLDIKIIKESLIHGDTKYYVSGVVYNAAEKPATNVTIKYYVWKKLIGNPDKTGYGVCATEKGGVIYAYIQYLPPKTPIEFVASGECGTAYVNLTPDPIEPPVITAEWEK